MLVKDIMSRAVKVAHPDDPVREAAVVMCLHKISGMPVVDDNGQIVGIISEKDILWAMFPSLQEYIRVPSVPDFEALENSYRDVVNQRVREVMTAKVFTVTPDMPALRAASIMFRNRIRRIPVADNGRLVGIVSVGDVHKAVFQANLMGAPTNSVHNVA
jgi:CBS domain-containing protein